MITRKLFAAKALAIAAIGVAVAGCETTDMLGQGEGKPVNEEVQARLASDATEKSVTNLGEATASDVIAISQPATETQNWLTVESSSFKKNNSMPSRFFSDDANGPKLNWSKVPQGAESFAIIVEDPDAAEVRPFVHLIIYNIPASQTEINLADLGKTTLSDKGMMLGKNSSNELRYHAPQAAAGEQHNYHYQVFALDGKLPLPEGANKKELLDAMNGHVIAKGEIVGTYQAKQ